MKNQTTRVEAAIAGSRKKNKRPRIENKRQSAEELEREQARRMLSSDSSVWAIVNQAKSAAAKQENVLMGDPMEQPYKTERERINHNGQKFSNMTIAEAFANAYGCEVTDINIGNEVPYEIAVGSIVNLTIQNIDKRSGVTFDSGAYKENFSTRNNLGHFKKFSEFLPTAPVKARVIERTPKHTMVDLFSPMVEDFVVPRSKTPWKQNRVKSKEIMPVTVKNLRLIRGGYLGQAVIPNISEWCGEDFVIEAFIPGSQIVLNTTNDFEQFDGGTVKAFVMSYAPKPNGRGMSLVCSAKNYLKHLGTLCLRDFHSAWCDASEAWDSITKTVYPGKITGVINSSKKCGIFVEIPELKITGMIPTSADKLVDYEAGKDINVSFKTFDEEMIYNDAVGQYQRVVPFEIEDGAIKKVNIKPIFEEVTI